MIPFHQLAHTHTHTQPHMNFACVAFHFIYGLYMRCYNILWCNWPSYNMIYDFMTGVSKDLKLRFRILYHAGHLCMCVYSYNKINVLLPVCAYNVFCSHIHLSHMKI